MATGKYVLDGKNAVPCNDLLEWGRWMETENRNVASTRVGNVRVSTAFLGLNNKFGPGMPLLFQTMIFGGPHDRYQTRSSTWDDAEHHHAVAVALASTPTSPEQTPEPLLKSHERTPE